MPPISMLIKPVSSTCNMACEYCFYSDVSSAREVQNYGLMELSTLKIIIKKAFLYAEQSANFGFQGGEPTLAGLDFFKTVVDLQKKYNTKRIKVNNSIQTNGLIIDDEWASFFHKNKFLVGVSLDGSQNIHDKYRLDQNKSGTFDRVMKSIKLLEKHKVDFNILTTVTLDVAENIDKIYYFFKKLGFRYLQFIPCLDELHQSKEKGRYSLTPKAYGEFLIKLFKLWYVDLNSKNMVDIRYFDNIVMMLCGYPPESCGMSGFCTCYYMIEADGSVYPCDFYVTDEWRLGNIKTDEFGDMLNCDKAKLFVDISKQVAQECRSCEHFRICRGGCRRNREPIGVENNNLNQLCEGFKMFFDYAMGDLEKLKKRFFG